MKRKKLLFLILFMACLVPAVLVGCVGQTQIVPSDHEGAGYQKVVFYYNGGISGSFTYNEYFVKNTERDGETIYHTFPAPGTNSVYSPVKTGYTFYGWYEVNFNAFTTEDEYVYKTYTDEHGEVHNEKVFNTKGEQATMKVPYIVRKDGETIIDEYSSTKILTLNDYEAEQQAGYTGNKIFVGPWNFDFNKVTKDTCLIAIWEPVRYFVVVPPENKNDIFDAEDYDKLPFGKFRINGALPRPTGSDLPKKKGFQVEDFYLDSACTVKVKFENDYYFPPKAAELVEGTERFKVFPIYTKWIDEKFTKIDKASSIRNMLRDSSYYIMNDLDFTGVTLSTPEIYRGEIRGNNHVWRNIKITVTEPTSPGTGLNIYGGLFKNLVGATIKNVAFENLDITFVRRDPSVGDRTTWSNPVKFNVFAKNIDERTILQNVDLGSSSESESSTFTIMNTIKFQEYTILNRDENGHPYRVSIGGKTLLYVPTLKDEQGNTVYDADDNPVYPDESSNYNGYKIQYVKNNAGEYTYQNLYATDALDGKTLWGNKLMPLPSIAPDVSIGQVGENFGFGNTSDKIDKCDYYVDRKEMNTPWQIEYKKDDPQPRPLSASVYTAEKNLEWAGWYYWDDDTYSYKIFDFTADDKPDSITLIAMWKKFGT